MSETVSTGNWQKFLAESDFPDEGKAAAKLSGWYVLVTKTDNGFFALNDRCTHQAAMISGGRVRRGAIMCPLHGARFDAESGACIGGAYPDLRRFPLRLVDGVIEIAIPETPPGIEDLPTIPSS